MREERAGFNSLLLSSIALITIVLAPLATLILMQMMFLPYHSFPITWVHRTLIVVDLGIVLIMWRRFFYNSGIENPLLFFGNRPRLRGGLAFAANLAAIYVVLWLSFGEGQWAGENQVLPPNYAATANGVVFGLFPDRLNLRNETIVGEKTLEETKKEIASASRERFRSNHQVRWPRSAGRHVERSRSAWRLLAQQRKCKPQASLTRGWITPA